MCGVKSRKQVLQTPLFKVRVHVAGCRICHSHGGYFHSAGPFQELLNKARYSLVGVVPVSMAYILTVRTVEAVSIGWKEIHSPQPNTAYLTWLRLPGLAAFTLNHATISAVLSDGRPLYEATIITTHPSSGRLPALEFIVLTMWGANPLRSAPAARYDAKDSQVPVLDPCSIETG